MRTTSAKTAMIDKCLQPSSRRFSPTRLATTLTSSSPALPSGSASTGHGHGHGPTQGFIILETNYRVYAYTGELTFLNREPPTASLRVRRVASCFTEPHRARQPIADGRSQSIRDSPISVSKPHRGLYHSREC
jgi:hypothetical protein